MKKQRATIYYSGDVQGVNFRNTTVELAGDFDVAGTVRNLADGRVEMVAEGEKEEISRFRESIRKSYLGGLITNEEEDWSEAGNGFQGFRVIR